jgi:hypothetical protein
MGGYTTYAPGWGVTQGVSPSTVPPLIPNWVPIQVGIGTTWKFTRTFANFPSNQWKYTIYWNGPTFKLSQDGIPTPADPPGSGFLIEVPASVTKNVPPGPYRYCERVTALQADEEGQIQVYDLSGDTLVTNVVGSPADSPPGYFQTWEEQTLAVVNAALAGSLSDSIQSYHIAGRAVSKYSLKELRDMRGFLNSVVWRQQHPGYLGKPYAVCFPFEPSAPQLPPTWVNITGIG